MAAGTVEIETPQGRLRGERAADVATFRGVPYASAPVGRLRLRPPEPAAPWPGTRDATRPSAMAPQAPTPFTGAAVAPLPTAEDCLTVDVWAPATGGGGRPVLVWVHGGSFVSGAGSVPWSDGTSLAAHGDVVVVTLNYRLGALGFLHLADLGGEAWASSGNAGLLDQLAALTWVRDHIEAFGGDPGNVTVFGESAGAMSIGALLAAPAARGLFHRAVLQSGAAEHVHDRDRATAVAAAVLEELGLSPGGLDRLAEVPVEAVVAAQTTVAGRRWPGGVPFRPVVDGTTLPHHPLEALAAGSAAGLPVVVGTNRDEMRLFQLLDARLSVGDDDALARRAERVFGPAADEALRRYRRNRPGAPPDEVWSAVLTDQSFRVPAVRLAERLARHSDRTWLYLFAWSLPSLGACHAAEIPFVFDTLDAPGVRALTGPVGADARRLAARLRDAWVAFARTGDPNGAHLPPWPPVGGGRRPTMVLDEPPEVQLDPGGDELALWPDVVPPDTGP